MKKSLLSMILASSLIFVLIFFTSCGEDKKQGPPPPQEIQVVEVIQKDVPIYKEFVGQVYGHSDIPIRARVTGFLEGIHFEEGLPVTKGQLLYSIDPSEYEAKVATQKSHLAEAKTSLTKSKNDLDRIKPLAEINAVSQSDLDAAQAEYDASVSYVNAMQSNLDYSRINLSYCQIKSPLNGLIGKTKARVGEFVGQNPNPVILNTVSTVDKIRVEFFITEADYIRLARAYGDIEEDLKKENKDREHLSLILADGSTFKHKGYVSFVNREVDAQTGSLLVQAIFPNPDKLLKPGQYSKVVIKMRNAKDAMLIPHRCIIELQGQNSVFVVKDDNTVESRQIVLGENIGDLQIVTSGLKPSEKVVIDALQKVKSGTVINPEVIVFESKTNSQD
ncbi:MAG: efflux RND transporter periplasmic adaptor subunit [Candidatus Neomarinimicrobiota bacterium]|nr:MAG: efflux RND transporter periplasmic adaptor subunit [Candidatus Neomarinimicrobiota bacterium]